MLKKLKCYLLGHKFKLISWDKKGVMCSLYFNYECVRCGKQYKKLLG